MNSNSNTPVRRRPLIDVQKTAGVATTPSVGGADKENEMVNRGINKTLPSEGGVDKLTKLNRIEDWLSSAAAVGKKTPLSGSDGGEGGNDNNEAVPGEGNNKELSKKKKKKVSKKKVVENEKSFLSIEIQTEDENVALITGEEASLSYWKILAETRRQALDEALQENYNLHQRVEELENENRLMEETVEEAKKLALMLENLNDELELDESGIADSVPKKEIDDSVLEKQDATTDDA